MLRFKKIYFLLFLLLLVIEVLIAIYIRDSFIRPYGGDFLVVIMVYCFVRAFVKIRILPAALFTLMFAYVVELGQLLNVLDVLGLRQNRPARIILGSAFEWGDMLAYTLGVVFVLLIEYQFDKPEA